MFDGHAGVDAATYAASHLHQNLIASRDFGEGYISDAFKEAFSLTDMHYLERSLRNNVKSGCTAVCCLLERHGARAGLVASDGSDGSDGKKRVAQKTTAFFAWLGDSQAILVKHGKPIDITPPHKPEKPEERARIEALGGLVVCVGKSSRLV